MNCLAVQDAFREPRHGRHADVRRVGVTQTLGGLDFDRGTHASDRELRNMTENRSPSPESTGGAGGSYEARVGAIALARLLRGDRIEGLGLPIVRVSLQQHYAGSMLDDVVVEGVDTLGRTRVIEYQAKRRVSPAPSDDDFVETIKRCLEEIRLEGDNGEIALGRKRFGLVSNPSGPLSDLARITVVARSHDQAASFLQVIRSTANSGVVQRLNQLRKTVIKILEGKEDNLAPAPSDADVDSFTWKIAKALHVWQVDAEPGGTAVLGTEDRLRDLLIGASDPAALFSALVDVARDWAPQAARIDLAMLRRALEDRGLALDQAPAQAAAFRALLAASADALDSGQARLGRQLLLPRAELRADIADAVLQQHATLLSGRAGVGKSMLGRLVADDLRNDGAIVVGLSLAGRTGSLHGLEEDLGVRLREGFAGAPVGGPRVVIIDGAEQVLSDAGRLLNAVLGTLPTPIAAAPSWHVLLTARDEAAGTVLSVVRERIADPGRLTVGELSDGEVARAVEVFPALAPLRRNPRAEALLLRRPYLIELLIRSTAIEALPADVVGEEDLLDVVTTRLVRRDNGGLPGRGAPDGRSDIYLALAAAAIADELPALLDGRDPESRQGLFSDDVITPTRPTQLSWRFAHDVLVDYAVASSLLEPGGPERLAAAVQPRRLLRAVRLRMQRDLADACADNLVANTWDRLTAEARVIANRDGARWTDVPYEALLHMGALRTALPRLTDVLLADDGAELFRLISVAERLARLNVAYDGSAPIPLDTALTGPVVDMLASLKARVPSRCILPTARLVHHHLAASFTYQHRPDAGLERIDNLPSAVVAWAGNDQYGDVLEYGLGSLGFLGPHLDGDAEAFLIHHAQRRPHEVAEVVESPAAGGALALSRPDLMLSIAGLYYLGTALSLSETAREQGQPPLTPSSLNSPPHSRHLDEGNELDEEGVREHDPQQSRHLDMFPLGNNQANPALGPFLALLNTHTPEGLRLIGAVVDAATTARARLEAGFVSIDSQVVHLPLHPNDSPDLGDFSGPATVWCWHRRTTVGPGPAQSALMALRQWASAQLSLGVPPKDVKFQILGAGSSLAFAAVAWFVMLEHLDLIVDEMDDFLVQPHVWALESTRNAHESSGLGLDVPEMTRLNWTVSQVAMQLVLRGDDLRRERLAALGTKLVENAEAEGSEDSALVQRWASELDIANYRSRSHNDGIFVSVEYDSTVLASLAKAGAAAQRSLNGASLMYQARAIRDGEAATDAAEGLWDEIGDYVREPHATDLYHPYELQVAAGASVLRAARDGAAVSNVALQDAVALLLAAAVEIDRLAPSPLNAPDSPPQAEDGSDGIAAHGERFIRDMSWDVGFDRSVATALPWLLADEGLMKRASVTPERVSEALVQAASGPYNEARGRLASGLIPLWTTDCLAGPHRHQTSVDAAARMLETAGYGPLNPYGQGFAQVTLPKPVDKFLVSSTELVLDLDAASHSIALLSEGSTLGCDHGVEARRILDSLIDYDERVWPERYARHHFSGTARWRTEIDRVLACRILAGDTDALDHHLNAFSGVDEQLAGLLKALPEQARDATTAAQLHAVWPRILDQLLPNSRNLQGGDNGRRRASYRDVRDLDRALLLTPTERVDYWPWSETVTLSIRWLVSFTGRADLADRAITFSSLLFGLRSEFAGDFSLRVLGNNFEAIKRESSLVVEFLRLTLQSPPSQVIAEQARTMLDGLAALGDEAALDVQRALENG